MEGAGKSTQAARLAERLERADVPNRVVREPGGTAVGERIRRVVLDPTLEPDARTELLLVLAARAEFVRRLVEPALERGEVVVSDRYELSTFAYQGLARRLGLERVRKLNRFATGGRKPDGVILLDLDPGEGRRRLGRGEREGPDRMERAGAAFHDEVARAYRELAETEPGVIRVDGGGAVQDVARRVWKSLSSRWPEIFTSGEAEGEEAEGGQKLLS